MNYILLFHVLRNTSYLELDDNIYQRNYKIMKNIIKIWLDGLKLFLLMLAFFISLSIILSLIGLFYNKLINIFNNNVIILIIFAFILLLVLFFIPLLLGFLNLIEFFKIKNTEKK